MISTEQMQAYALWMKDRGLRHPVTFKVVPGTDSASETSPAPTGLEALRATAAA